MLICGTFFKTVSRIFPSLEDSWRDTGSVSKALGTTCDKGKCRRSSQCPLWQGLKPQYMGGTQTLRPSSTEHFDLFSFTAQWSYLCPFAIKSCLSEQEPTEALDIKNLQLRHHKWQFRGMNSLKFEHKLSNLHPFTNFEEICVVSSLKSRACVHQWIILWIWCTREENISKFLEAKRCI